MAKILKRLSAKVDKQTGKSEIMFRFVGGFRIEARAKSGIFIDPKTWNEKKGELKSATFGREQAEIKTKLDTLCTIILNTFTETEPSKVNGEWLTSLIDKFHYPEKYEIKEETPKQTFFEVFDEFLEVRKLSDVRKRNFRVIYRALQRYEIYKDITLDLDTVTDAILRDIDKFLREEHILCDKPKYQRVLKVIPERRPPQPRGQNTINDIFTKIRTFWLWCIEEGKTTNLPKIKIENCVYGTPYYITIEERKQIESADLSAYPQLAIQRDIFVFQCCIGCRVGDLYKMTRQNVVDGAIQYVPRKTKEGRPITVSVPLNSVAMAILDRYEVEANNRLLPYISEQKYNDAIKRIFELSGVDRIVQVRNALTGDSEPRPIYEVASSHLARRTFVGNLYKQVKDPNLVGALSGHKEGSKAFARYRDIDNDMKVELVKLLE
ncbi:MAG: tyrosine-type recombinase/integrase [Rikenellaceae bacterium]